MGYYCTMKLVKVLLSEDLLAELDDTAEVREKGRAVVLRQLVSDFLRQHREREIDAQYERAYKKTDAPLGEEFAGWESASSAEQIRQIEDGLREADAGDFASDEEVAAVFARWTKTPVTPSSGNVFADLGFTEPEEELAKAQLASHIRRIIRRRRLTQVAAAALMGIDQPKVSALINGRLANFSAGRLMRLLTTLG
jgi:predicted XRE-type DNA-binding protein/predicted transcriptional regulator